MSKNGIIRLFLGTKKTYLRLRQNTSTFELKRPYVLNKTQVRLKQNAFAFWIKRKGVLKEYIKLS